MGEHVLLESSQLVMVANARKTMNPEAPK